MSQNISTICHTLLLIACVIAITSLALIDIRNGGDGGALAAGLAALAAVGGFSLQTILPPNAN